MKEKAESLRQQSQQLPDLEAVRDRILSEMRLGRQSPEFRKAKAALDRFISEVRDNAA